MSNAVCDCHTLCDWHHVISNNGFDAIQWQLPAPIMRHLVGIYSTHTVHTLLQRDSEEMAVWQAITRVLLPNYMGFCVCSYQAYITEL